MRLITLLLVAMFTVSLLSACGGGTEAPTQDIKARDAAAAHKPGDPVPDHMIPDELKKE